MKRPLLRHAGFTLLEIMLVVAIIGILAGIAVVTMGGNLDDARKTAASADIRNITTQLTLFNSQTGSYPTTEQGLKALVAQPEPKPRNWRQYLKDLPEDPWQREYFYKRPGERNPSEFDLFSAGPDGLPNTADDIGNWKAPK